MLKPNIIAVDEQLDDPAGKSLMFSRDQELFVNNGKCGEMPS